MISKISFNIQRKGNENGFATMKLNRYVSQVAEKHHRILEFIQTARDAENAYRRRVEWLPYYNESCTLFVVSKLDEIHRAKSSAALSHLYWLVRDIAWLYSDPYEIVFKFVYSRVQRCLMLHPDFQFQGLEQFTSAVRLLEKSHPSVQLKPLKNNENRSYNS